MLHLHIKVCSSNNDKHFFVVKNNKRILLFLISPTPNSLCRFRVYLTIWTRMLDLRTINKANENVH